MTDTLDAARQARLDTILDRRMRDRITGEIYTHRERLARGAYAYRVTSIERGKRDTYCLILATECTNPCDPCYLTPMVPVPKIVHDYAEALPALECDENTMTVRHYVTDAEWAHLAGAAV